MTKVIFTPQVHAHVGRTGAPERRNPAKSKWRISRRRPVTFDVRCLGRRTISIPPLSSAGDLPVGVHRSTLAELSAAFGCASRERQILFERIARIYRIAAATRHLARFVVFGSFVSQKPVPNDVDIFMVFDDAFDASICDHETMMLLDHATADTYFGASVFWLRRPAAFGGEQATIEFWQTKRDGSRRGIVEIAETKE